MATMKHGDYIARIDFDESAEAFHGRVININDVVNFYGASVEELEREFATSIQVYEEFCREKGIEPNKPFSGRFNVRLTADQHSKVSAAAALEGKSLNAWVAEVLEREAGKVMKG